MSPRSAWALGALLFVASACVPGLEEMRPFPCAQDGTCPLGLACVERQCRSPVLGGVCQETTRCDALAAGALCVQGVCATPPEAPTGVLARRVLDTAQVSWTAPTSHGGLPLLGFSVRSDVGNLHADVAPAVTSVTLPGLVEGSTYTFTVVAKNAAGSSAAAASNALTVHPPSAPGAPGTVTAVAGVMEAQVSWSAPLDDGGRAISGYTVTVLPGGATVEVDASLLTAKVSGLRAGTRYTFTVAARNSIGSGPQSAPSNEVIPSARPPAAPTDVAATAGPKRAVVSWTAPADDGGSAITGYTVKTDPGGGLTQLDGEAASTTITGLVPGTTYRFTVWATNSAGAGEESAPSNAIAPHAEPPSAPRSVAAVAGPEEATVTWSAPADDGGSPITGYRVTVVGGNFQDTNAAARSLRISGLKGGTTYTFTVSATNAAGRSPASAASNAVTPSCLAGFLAPASVSILEYATAIATADFDGDGRMDFVVANLERDDLGLFLGNADGTFQARRSIAKSRSRGTSVMAVGDFNKDGKPDLLIGLEYADVAVLLNSGGGTFQWPTVYEAVAGLSHGQGVVVADFNGDGNLDAAMTSPNQAGDPGRVGVIFGTGTGTFGAATWYDTASGAKGLAAADLNGDGRPDLLVASSDTNSLSVLVNNGNGTFKTKVDYAVGRTPWAVVTGDFNGDGKVDVAVAASGDAAAQPPVPGALSVLLGKGDGTLQPQTQFEIGLGARALSTGDLNGDGRIDLVTSHFAGHKQFLVKVLLGKGDGAFEAGVGYVVEDGSAVLAVADFDGDGRSDVGAANYYSGTLTVFHPNADGALRGGTVHSAGLDPRSVAAGDLNGDGKADLVAVDRTSNVAAVLLGNGNGTFRSRAVSPTGNGPESVALGHFDGDGKLDVVVANQLANTVSVLLGNGDGTLRTRVDYAVGAEPTYVTVGDFDGDGATDLMVANTAGNSVSVLLGNGNGTFRPHIAYPTQPAPAFITLGDLNGDGRLDATLIHPGKGNHTRLLGGADGVFEPVTFSGMFTSALVCDADGDGKLDLAGGQFVNDKGQGFLWFGQGDGTFQRYATLFTEASYSRPISLASGDFDGNGRVDLAVLFEPLTLQEPWYRSPHVAVFGQNEDGTFRAPQTVPTGAGPRSMISADFNGDGRPDLAVVTKEGILVAAPACPP